MYYGEKDFIEDNQAMRDYTTTNKWIRVAWRNEIQKEQISLKKEVEKAMRKVEVTVSFDERSVIIGEESHTEWKEGWKKLKKILTEGQKRNKQQSLAEKELQSEISKHYSEEDCGWLKCNTDPGKHHQYSHYTSK